MSELQQHRVYKSDLSFEISEDETFLIEDEFVLFSYKDDIMIGRYKPEKHIDLKAAQQIARTREAAFRIARQEKMMAIAEISHLKSVSAEARKFFASPEQTKRLLAGALVTKSLVGYVMGSFFIKLNPIKKIPENMFRTIDEAKNWMNELDLKA